MRVQSDLSVKDYLRMMRTSLEPISSFGEERLIGTIIGPFFSVTYCSGYEFNRRITNEKSRAIGFVREKDGGTEVRCIRLKGMTNPISLILMYALFLVMFAISEPWMACHPVGWLTSLAGTIMVAVITAIQDSLTERGQEGSNTLTRFLQNPEKFSRWY